MQPLNLRIRLARLTRGLEQKQLARTLGISPQHLSQWECGGTTPRRDNIEKIAAATGVCDLWLFKGEGWMIYHDWPPDLQGWLQGQFLLHDVQRVVIVSYPEWIVLRIGFLLESAQGILSVGALRKPRTGWAPGVGRDAEAYFSILRDLKRRRIPIGHANLASDVQAAHLGDLSEVVPYAKYIKGWLDQEIAGIPQELRPSPDQAGYSIESSISGDRPPSISTRGAITEEPNLERLVREADGEMKDLLALLLRTTDADTRGLISRLLREADPDAKKEMMHYLDVLGKRAERRDPSID